MKENLINFLLAFLFMLWLYGCFDFIIWTTEHSDVNLIELINNLTISKTLRVMWWTICIKWAINIIEN